MRASLAAVTKRLLRRPADMLLRSASHFQADVEQVVAKSNALLDNPFLPTKFYPAYTEAAFFEPAPIDTPPRGYDGLPVPPRALMEGYFDASGDAYYLRTGLEGVTQMRAILRQAGITLTGRSRILEMGCSAGRMLRHLASLAEEGAVIHGVDISAANIAWAQRYLSPPFQFTTCTTLPYLPFEDRSFDLIFAASVFTHIRALPDMWLRELRRLLVPGGALFISVLDEHAVRAEERQSPANLIPRIIARYEYGGAIRRGAFDTACVAQSPRDATVFYSEAFIRRTWTRDMILLSYTPEGNGFQSAVLLQRPHL